MILQKWWEWYHPDPAFTETWRTFLTPKLRKNCDEWCNPVIAFSWGPVNINWWYKLENRQDLWFMIGMMGRKEYDFISPDYTAVAKVPSTPELDHAWDSLEYDEDWHPPLWTVHQLIKAGARFESLEDA